MSANFLPLFVYLWNLKWWQYFEVKVCNKCIVVKTAVLLDYNIFRCPMITENKHLSRDPQLSSVTRNCQIYSRQLDTLKTGIFNLKKNQNFIIVRRNYVLNNLCSFVSPNFFFKETGFVNFFTDPELSSSLYLKCLNKCKSLSIYTETKKFSQSTPHDECYFW